MEERNRIFKKSNYSLALECNSCLAYFLSVVCFTFVQTCQILNIKPTENIFSSFLQGRGVALLLL